MARPTGASEFLKKKIGGEWHQSRDGEWKSPVYPHKVGLGIMHELSECKIACGSESTTEGVQLVLPDYAVTSMIGTGLFAGEPYSLEHIQRAAAGLGGRQPAI